MLQPSSPPSKSSHYFLDVGMRAMVLITVMAIHLPGVKPFTTGSMVHYLAKLPQTVHYIKSKETAFFLLNWHYLRQEFRVCFQSEKLYKYYMLELFYLCVVVACA
jgi:hypothetical protein